MRRRPYRCCLTHSQATVEYRTNHSPSVALERSNIFTPLSSIQSDAIFASVVFTEIPFKFWNDRIYGTRIYRRPSPWCSSTPSRPSIPLSVANVRCSSLLSSGIVNVFRNDRPFLYGIAYKAPILWPFPRLRNQGRWWRQRQLDCPQYWGMDSEKAKIHDVIYYE